MKLAGLIQVLQIEGGWYIPESAIAEVGTGGGDNGGGGAGGGIAEAPTDGQLYGRENRGWSVVPGGGGAGGGIPEAPGDYADYLRNGGYKKWDKAGTAAFQDVPQLNSVGFPYIPSGISGGPPQNGLTEISITIPSIWAGMTTFITVFYGNSGTDLNVWTTNSTSAAGLAINFGGTSRIANAANDFSAAMDVYYVWSIPGLPGGDTFTFTFNGPADRIQIGAIQVTALRIGPPDVQNLYNTGPGPDASMAGAIATAQNSVMIAFFASFDGFSDGTSGWNIALNDNLLLGEVQPSVLTNTEVPITATTNGTDTWGGLGFIYRMANAPTNDAFPEQVVLGSDSRLGPAAARAGGGLTLISSDGNSTVVLSLGNDGNVIATASAGPNNGKSTNLSAGSWA